MDPFLNKNNRKVNQNTIKDNEILCKRILNEIKKPVKINGEDKSVWCTFGHDQIDFDFSNPEVLKEFVSIIKFY